ncbi:MAG: helix-turn-helix domain-containing protein [Acidobacteria bacterium]|nr:helix-turn-helix domain-containing protein [Acidobacteriota bacterium]
MSDFGTELKQARERQGISLRQIATSTKISVVALEALERGDFSQLPGGIFSRSFVRSYAIEVGLDPDGVVEQFLVELGAARPAADDSPRPAVTDDDRAFLERQRKAGVYLRAALVVLVVVVVALIAWRVSRVSQSASGEVTAPVSSSDDQRGEPNSPTVQAVAPATAGPERAEPES